MPPRRLRIGSCRLHACLSGFLACGLCAAWVHVSKAAPPSTEPDRFQAQLDAGEFAPAIAQAHQATAPAGRDARLSQVAVAQARAGAHLASWQTAADIDDDRSRSSTLAQISEQPLGGRGGAEPNFDDLIELITSTIAPPTWDKLGGPGAISEFEGGVYVDAEGVLRRLVQEESGRRLTGLRLRAARPAASDDVRRGSALRKVSLTRLERLVQLRLASGRPPTEAMRLLAGLQRIQYVFVYPESGDLVLAGPAGDWTTDTHNRIVGVDSRRPVVRLDDLVVVWRHVMQKPGERFGCSITPTRDALKRTNAFLAASNKTPLRAGQSAAWLEQLRAHLGRQNIDVYGVDPGTRAARVMVEADYHMKRIGMGLEEGTLGVESYLDSIHVPKGEAPPPFGMLRWWFTLNYKAVLSTADRDGFEIRGQGVQVKSENELLAGDGQRIHTGKSDELTKQFARSFTTHFDALATRYPVYAEMQNIFDLAIAGALIQSEDLAGKVGWHMTCFGDPQGFPVEQGPAPKTVETVVNHRIIHRVHILAGVSGGVRVVAAPLVARDAIELDRYGRLTAEQARGVPKNLPRDRWWWD